MENGPMHYEGPQVTEVTDQRIPPPDSEAARSKIQLLLSANEAQRLERRTQLAREAEEIFSIHNPDIIQQFHETVEQECAGTIDFSEFAAETVWASHYHDGGEEFLPFIAHHLCSIAEHLEHWEDVDQILDSELIKSIISMVWDEGIQDRIKFADRLGRIKAIDLCQEEQANDPKVLPLYLDPEVRDQSLPYVDIATGFDSRPYLVFLALHQAPLARSVQFNDYSEFVCAEFDEERSIFGVDQQKVTMIPNDGSHPYTLFDRHTIGTLHMGNPGAWIYQDDPEWYSQTADLITPHRGKLVLTVGGVWDEIKNSTNLSKKALSDILTREAVAMFRLFGQGQLDEKVSNMDMVLHFHEQLMEKQQNKWELSIGSSTNDGQFHTGGESDSHRSFVFTRIG